MLSKRLIGACFSALVALPTGALAGTPGAVMEQAFGHDVAWAVPVRDDALDGIRGGAGVVFGVSFTGELEINDPGGVPEGLTVTRQADNMVQVTGGVGNFGGANGVFQFTNVEGSLNVVNNNMVINIAVVNSPSTNLSSLFSGLP